jgi:hypothetical protein
MARPVTLVERLGARFFALLAADPYGAKALVLRQVGTRAEADLALAEALDRNPDLGAAYAAWLAAGRKAREAAHGAVLVALPGQRTLARAIRLRPHLDAETLSAGIEARIECARRRRGVAA